MITRCFDCGSTDPNVRHMVPVPLSEVPANEREYAVMRRRPCRNSFHDTTWDERWMSLAKLVAGWSKDRSRKCGAVIVDDRQTVLALGWNGFPRGIKDEVDERHERPAKYQWTEHAERNAIYNAAANGHSVRGARMYLSWYPCADCARAIIQSGIKEIVCVEPDWADPQWASDFAVVATMLDEARVRSVFLEGHTAPEIDAASIPSGKGDQC